MLKRWEGTNGIERTFRMGFTGVVVGDEGVDGDEIDENAFEDFFVVKISSKPFSK